MEYQKVFPAELMTEGREDFTATFNLPTIVMKALPLNSQFRLLHQAHCSDKGTLFLLLPVRGSPSR